MASPRHFLGRCYLMGAGPRACGAVRVGWRVWGGGGGVAPHGGWVGCWQSLLHSWQSLLHFQPRIADRGKRSQHLALERGLRSGLHNEVSGVMITELQERPGGFFHGCRVHACFHGVATRLEV